MYFQIKKIILWPRKPGLSYKEIVFELGKVNVITGASRTGKSAIIPIVDYCLGSKECGIPVNIIRNACCWFGVVIKTKNFELLLARREPEDQKSTDDMMLVSDKEIIIPEKPIKNNSRAIVCKYLDELAKLTFLDLDDGEYNGFDARPSFRDMMAFCYQPQNIIANSNTLFYKADTMEHRQKLINIFPYILGAVNAQTLAKRKELEDLKKELKKKEHELERIRDVSTKWDIEIRSWLNAAKCMGLLDENIDVSGLTYSACIDYLSKIANSNIYGIEVTSDGINTAIKEINLLKKQEREVSFELSVYTNRKIEMSRYYDNIDEYRKNLSIQRERLDISTWIAQLANENGTCPFCGAQHKDDEQISKLLLNLKEVEVESNEISEIPISFEREFSIVQGKIGELTETLEAIQNSIKIIERELRTNREEQYTMEEIMKFVGKSQYAADTFKSINSDSQLIERIRIIQDRINVLQKDVNEYAVRNRIETSLKKVENIIMYHLPMLDLENPDAPVDIDYKNLTITVRGDNDRNDYLWQIGSGSNWLAYHIAVSLAFQRFAFTMENSPIPQFLIFDQPSQVYFPKKIASKVIEDDDQTLADEDILAVHKIFATMNDSIQKCDNSFQIIVLEHADEEVWSGLNNVYKVCEWRGTNSKLIPKEWIIKENKNDNKE